MQCTCSSIRPSLAVLTGLSFVLALASESPAQALAESFPADAIVYLRVDSTKTVDGMLNLDAVKLLDEPQIQEFLKPMAEELPQLSTAGLRDMLDLVPWRDFVDGSVELAFRGVRVDIGGQVIELSPSQPISARALNRLAGASARFADPDGGGSGGMALSLGLDLVARAEVGPGFRTWFDGVASHFGELGIPLQAESCEVGGKQALRFITSGAEGMPGLTTYVVDDGKRFWLGGNRATLERCLKGQAQDSLAHAKSYRDFVAQTGGGDPAALLYVNVANAGRIFGALIQPIVKEELELFGFTAIEAFGYAMTFTEGGVRDAFALTFNAPPQGFLSLLDCCDGGFSLLRKAPVEAGLYLGMRLDPERFVDRLMQVGEELFPGTGALAEKGLAEASRAAGVDVRHELLAAFGDEIGLYLTPPGGGSSIPDGMLMLKVGDRQQFEKIFRRHLGDAEAAGHLQVTELKTMPAGAVGWSLTIADMPFQPAIALTDEHLVVGVSAPLLKSKLKLLAGGQERTAADNPNLKRVLTGLTGKPSDAGLSLLGFVDLGRGVEVAYQFAPLVAGQIRQETDGKVDLAGLPEAEVLSRHFSGIGIGGRSDAHGLVLSFFTPGGLLTMGAAAAIVAQRQMAAAMTFATPFEDVPAPEPAATSAPVAQKTGDKLRPLAELFSLIEKATGATINFPEEIGRQQVTYKPSSGDLKTILGELSVLAGFSFEVEEFEGETLVFVSNG